MPSISLLQIAELSGGKIIRGESQQQFDGLAALADAGSTQVSFLGNPKYFEQFLQTSAGCVLVTKDLPKYPEHELCLVEVENPTHAFGAIVSFFKQQAPKQSFGVHASAVVDASARFSAEKVHIGARVVVGADVEIGDGCILHAGVVLYDGVKLGKDCVLHANAVVREFCVLGNNVVLQPGATIGADGFGYQFIEGRHQPIEQLGNVVLGDYVEVGAGSCIDRARFGTTSVGEGSKIDNLVQLGHNVQVGKHCIIIAQTGIAGSTHIGDYCTIAAQCGIAGHLKIGAKATLASKSGVIADLAGDKIYWGTPAVALMDARRQYACLQQLPAMVKEFKALKKKFGLDEMLKKDQQ